MWLQKKEKKKKLHAVKAKKGSRKMKVVIKTQLE